jgi:hypothetical protein
MFVADFGEQSPNQFEQDRAKLKAGAIVRHRQRPEGPANLFIVTNRTTRAGVLQMRAVNAEHDYSGFYPASELEFLQSTTARQAVGRRRVLLAYGAEHYS